MWCASRRTAITSGGRPIAMPGAGTHISPVMRVIIGTCPADDYAIERTGYKTANDVNVRTSTLAGWRTVPQGRVYHVGSSR